MRTPPGIEIGTGKEELNRAGIPSVVIPGRAFRPQTDTAGAEPEWDVHRPVRVTGCRSPSRDRPQPEPGGAGPSGSRFRGLPCRPPAPVHGSLGSDCSQCASRSLPHACLAFLSSLRRLETGGAALPFGDKKPRDPGKESGTSRDPYARRRGSPSLLVLCRDRPDALQGQLGADLLVEAVVVLQDLGDQVRLVP